MAVKKKVLPRVCRVNIKRFYEIHKLQMREKECLILSEINSVSDDFPPEDAHNVYERLMLKGKTLAEHLRREVSIEERNDFVIHGYLPKPNQVRQIEEMRYLFNCYYRSKEEYDTLMQAQAKFVADLWNLKVSKLNELMYLSVIDALVRKGGAVHRLYAKLNRANKITSTSSLTEANNDTHGTAQNEAQSEAQSETQNGTQNAVQSVSCAAYQDTYKLFEFFIEAVNNYSEQVSLRKEMKDRGTDNVRRADLFFKTGDYAKYITQKSELLSN